MCIRDRSFYAAFCLSNTGGFQGNAELFAGISKLCESILFQMLSLIHILFNAGMGVDVKINQADLIGHMIADEMNYHSIMTLMKLSKGEYSIVRVQVDYHSPNANKSIAEIKLPAQALLIAVYEDDTLIIPHGETIIRAGQYILAFADEAAMEELNRIFGSGTSED